MYRKLLTASLIGLSSLNLSARATFGTYGGVSSIVTLGDKVFVAGNFRQVGSLAPYGGIFSTVDGKVDYRTARPDGIVRTVVSDGAGGWYIGGTFQNVGGARHAAIAHILPDGSVSSWNPQIFAGMQGITAMTVYGGKLYIGGEFYSIGGYGSSIGTTMYQRQCMASFDLATGMLTSFAPNVNNTVYSITGLGDKVYAGGDFTQVNNWSASRSNLAAFDTATGTVTSWAPVIGARVNAIAACGPRLIIGGTFGSVNGSFNLRGRIAMIDTVTGAPTSWNPDIWGNQVSSIIVSGSKVFAGGDFHTVNSSAYIRSGLVLLDTASNLPMSWDPQLPPYTGIYSMQFQNGKLYAGGAFTDNVTYAHSGVAVFDSLTATRLAWDPRIGGAVYSIGVQGNAVYAAGDYLIANTVDRNGMAAYYARTGEVAPWNPDANTIAQSLVAAGDKIYAGGDFTTVNGGTVIRNHMAAFDTATGAATAWNPNSDYNVTKLVRHGTKIYALGNFTQVNGTTARSNVASFDTAAGTVTSWNPGADSWIGDISASGSQIFLGGGFRTINGNVSRWSLAAVDTVNGTATAWDPYTDGSVQVVYADGDKVYVGGSFTAVDHGTVSRQRIAALDTSAGHATAWNPSLDYMPAAIVRNGANIFASGYFTNVNGNVYRPRIAQFDTVSGTVTSWNASAGSGAYISALLPAGNGIYIGGSFDKLGDALQSNFSVLNAVTGTPLGVQLEAFTATRQGSVNQLSWKARTAATDIIQLEKSADGASFSSFATLSGSEGTGSRIDAAPYSGVTYYRLRMLSASGKYSFSEVVSVRSATAAATSVSLAPVPASTELTLTNTDAALNGSPVQVLDLQGREMTRFNLEPRRSLDLAAWPAGSYIMKLSNGTNLRFVKQ